jgi:hypothetical protein
LEVRGRRLGAPIFTVAPTTFADHRRRIELMDRRKTLATVGAISLTASAAFVALGSSMGLFGLTDTGSRVGKLSPIDATRPVRTTTKTIIVDDPVPVPAPTGAGTTTEPDTTGAQTHHEGHGSDDSPRPAAAPGVEAGTTPAPSAPSAPSADDHGTDDTSHDAGSKSDAGHGHDDD